MLSQAASRPCWLRTEYLKNEIQAVCNSTDIAASTWYNLTNMYDLAGDPISYTDGFGTTITSTYDAAGRPSTVTGSGTAYSGPIWASNSYGAVGLLQATLGNQAVQNLQYNNRLAVQSSSTANSSGTTLYSESLSYFGNMNLQTASDSVNGNWTYTNDTLNRLSTAVSSNTSEGCQYSYDAFGNRTGESATSQSSCFSSSLSVNAANQIAGYCYDGAGNLLDAGPCPAAGANHQYFYDGYGDLLSPNDNNSDATSYTVDALGHRVAKWSNGALSNQYLYGIDGNVVAEMDGSGNWLETNVHAGGQFLAQLQPPGITFRYTDHLGTLRAWSGPGGAAGTCASLPFGETTTCTGPPEYFFTGKERDTESGNDYFGARYYASSMGRFMSPDPSQLYFADPMNPQTLNLYSYALNNPLKLTDPTGFEAACHWSGNDWDDTPENGGAKAGECEAQGGSFEDIPGPVTDVTVTANSDGSDTVDIDTHQANPGEMIPSVTPNGCPGVPQHLPYMNLNTNVQKTNLLKMII